MTRSSASPATTIFVGGTGADALHGGPGSDTAGYYISTAGIMASLSEGVGVGGDAEGDTYSSIENLEGSNYADALVGNDGNNWLGGGWGDDLLDGRDGDDILYAGPGNDTLKGGGGADWLRGLQGIDTASYYELPEGVIVLLGLVERAATPKATPSRTSRTSPARSTPTTCGEMTASTSSWAWTAT